MVLLRPLSNGLYSYHSSLWKNALFHSAENVHRCLHRNGKRSLSKGTYSSRSTSFVEKRHGRKEGRREGGKEGRKI